MQGGFQKNRHADQSVVKKSQVVYEDLVKAHKKVHVAASGNGAHGQRKGSMESKNPEDSTTEIFCALLC